MNCDVCANLSGIPLQGQTTVGAVFHSCNLEDRKALNRALQQQQKSPVQNSQEKKKGGQKCLSWTWVEDALESEMERYTTSQKLVSFLCVQMN